MGNLIKQNVGQVASNGNGLVIFIDVATGEVMLKDVVGNTQLLKDFFKYNEIVFLKADNGSFVSTHENNKVLGEYSAVLSGEFNIVRADNSVVLGGNANTLAGNYSVILGGKGHNIDSQYSSISGGTNNKTTYDNTHILGSNIEANREDCTFVENLSITNAPISNKGLPKGAIWNDNGTLKIVG